MDERAPMWRPSREEVERILAEMKPIVVEFAKRARAAGQVQPQ